MKINGKGNILMKGVKLKCVNKKEWKWNVKMKINGKGNERKGKQINERSKNEMYKWKEWKWNL